MNESHIIYSFTFWWTFSTFPFWAIKNRHCFVHLNTSLWVASFLFLFGKHLWVEYWVIEEIYVYLNKKLPNCQSGYTRFHSSYISICSINSLSLPSFMSTLDIAMFQLRPFEYVCSWVCGFNLHFPYCQECWISYFVVLKCCCFLEVSVQISCSF